MNVYSVKTVEPQQKPLPSGDVETALSEYKDKLTFELIKDKVFITAKWMGKDKWREVNTIIEAHGGEWIKDGKDSHWEVPT